MVAFAIVLVIQTLRAYSNRSNVAGAEAFTAYVTVGVLFGLFAGVSWWRLNKALQTMKDEQSDAQRHYGHLSWNYCLRMKRNAKDISKFERHIAHAGFKYAVKKFKQYKKAKRNDNAFKHRMTILAVLAFFERHNINFGWVHKEIR